MPKQNKLFTVREENTLLLFVETALKLTRKKAKELLVYRSIVVNNRIETKHDFPLKKGDVVIIDYNNKFDILIQSGIKIIHEDNELIVISKPHGMLTVADGKNNLPTVFTIMKAYSSSPVFIVHRLDRDTSGVLILTKSKQLKEAFQENWNSIVKSRLYYAVTEGVPKNKSDTLVSYLTEDKNHMVHSTGDKTAERAVTNFTVIKEGKDYALLDINIETGKKNQIRIALRDIGHPIVGDKKYGAETNPLKRLGLHAYNLTFIHPLTGKETTYESKIPNGFLNLVKTT